MFADDDCDLDTLSALLEEDSNDSVSAKDAEQPGPVPRFHMKYFWPETKNFPTRKERYQIVGLKTFMNLDVYQDNTKQSKMTNGKKQ